MCQYVARSEWISKVNITVSSWNMNFIHTAIVWFYIFSPKINQSVRILTARNRFDFFSDKTNSHEANLNESRDWTFFYTSCFLYFLHQTTEIFKRLFLSGRVLSHQLNYTVEATSTVLESKCNWGCVVERVCACEIARHWDT